jgi:hypothetical protein
MNNQLEAVKLLKDWSTWLVTVQTGALGLITIFSDKKILTFNCWSVVTVLSFTLSIFAATWVLGALPSIAQRITAADNVHAMHLFEWLPIRLWVASGLQHLLFVAGIFALAGYMLSSMLLVQ